ncbi:MAG TPA: tetratricopeptide repeat protein [Candidatus Acidoferrales bacterium]|nr:tetratricopeptide repeat protein [Candidatus Acidoferrales bacterium]
MTRHQNTIFPLRLTACVALICAARLALADTTNLTTNASAAVDGTAKTAEAAVISNQSTLRSTLEIQEQLHNLQVADEKARRQAEADYAQSQQLLDQRLGAIETALASQHIDGLREIQHSNDMVLIASGAFACFGFLVLILSALLQWQMVNRIKVLAAAVPSARGLGAGEEHGALGAGDDAHLLPGGGVARPTAEFLGAIERLEKRINEMETSVHPQHALAEGGSSNGGSLELAGSSENGKEPVSPESFQKAKTISVLLSKGQTQLKLDQPEAALASFDEALALDPEHTDAMLKRGAALERLQRLNEAIECYDRAIATDSTMTMAYLHKGGVFNRMERYSEALECYEQALRSQEKGRTAEVMAE